MDETATTVARRPMLRRGVRRLWRGPDTLQLGRRPGGGAVLAGLDEATRAVLGLLDGSRSRTQVIAQAATLGCPSARTAELLALLEGAGLVRDAAATCSTAGLGTTREERDRRAVDLDELHPGGAARRGTAAVVVLGAGRVGAAVASLLAAAGVGAVDVVDDGVTRASDTGVGAAALRDVGRPRGVAARAQLEAMAPSVRTGPLSQADLVVLAPVGPEDLEAAGGWAARASPHLYVEVQDNVGVVGPLVVPSHTPCLRCLDLHRTDRDPDWPMLAVQLSAPVRDLISCDATLAVAVAAQATLQALTYLDGGTPATCAGTLELTLPGWQWRRRSWTPHPECDCGVARSA